MNPFLRFMFFALAFAQSLQGVEPLISSLLPRGGMKESVQEVVIRGQRLDKATEFFFYSEGIKVSKIVEEKSTVLKASFSISDKAAFGQHKLRIRTNEGLSNLYTFWVGPFPNVQEKEPNSGFDEAQGIPINSTVNGVILNEDVDYFEINATKGQRISVEIEAIRLSGPLFDPYVALLDDKRFELATSDDSELLLQDSTLSVIAPGDGVYRIEVRDSSYKGASSYQYRLHVGNFPRPLVVFPAGGEAGKTQEFTFLGDAKGTFKAKITLPAKPIDNEFAYHHRESNLSSPSPNRIRVSSFPSVRETEPNQNRKVATVTELSLPLAFDGIIQEDGDIDYFRFHAKKGQRYYIRAMARAVASPLDPVLNLYDGEGKSLVGNDDSSNGPDSLLTYTFPKDGEYLLRITDHLSKGSPRHVYRIESHRLTPEVAASIPMFRNRDTQTRQMLPIARGNSVATALNISRKSFRGDLEFIAQNLPAGVTMEAPVVHESFTSAPILFRAAPDAPLANSLIDLRLKYENTEKKQLVEGSFAHKVSLVYGAPNNRTYYETKVNRLAVGVVDSLPFKVKLHQPVTPIVKNGSQNLKVEIIRDANFTKAVTVRILTRPPGIGAKSSLSIATGKSIGYYPLTANGAAAVGVWKIGVQAETSAPGGGIWRAASDFIDLKIEEPYLSMKINMAAVQRGQDGEMLCDLNVKRPFEGIATAELKGLPPFSATTKIEFDSNTSQISFPISTEDKSRAGLTKNLFCYVKIPYSGELITHSAGQGGQIRLDNPPPKPKAPAKPKPKAVVAKAPPKPAKKKQLSRLEQLRLAAQGGSN
jgi:hypothetical protein